MGAEDIHLDASLDAIREATGIQTIKSQQTDEPLYDLQGRKVAAPVGKGIYLRNGKKFIIK